MKNGKQSSTMTNEERIWKVCSEVGGPDGDECELPEGHNEAHGYLRDFLSERIGKMREALEYLKPRRSVVLDRHDPHAGDCDHCDSWARYDAAIALLTVEVECKTCRGYGYVMCDSQPQCAGDLKHPCPNNCKDGKVSVPLEKML